VSDETRPLFFLKSVHNLENEIDRSLGDFAITNPRINERPQRANVRVRSTGSLLTAYKEKTFPKPKHSDRNFWVYQLLMLGCLSARTARGHSSSRLPGHWATVFDYKIAVDEVTPPATGTAPGFPTDIQPP